MNSDDMSPCHEHDSAGYAHEATPPWAERHQAVQAMDLRLASVQSGIRDLSFVRDSMELDQGPQESPSPSPPTRPYIRPAVREDAEDIVQIINWHTSASHPHDPDLELLEAEHVCNFIETSHYRRLPFLVIVQPPDLSQISGVIPKSQVCGLAYIDVFDDIATEDSIGDLRVYVPPPMMRCGFGTVLVDCILAICDEHYRRRCNVEWRPIGKVQLDVLRLRQLMCAISYPAQVEHNYAFTWHWLKTRFGFNDFGEIRQDRAKNGHEYVVISWLSVFV